MLNEFTEKKLRRLPVRGYSLDDVWQLIDLKRYQGTMIVVPAFDFKLEPFDPKQIPARDPKWNFFAVNVFLRAVEKTHPRTLV
jgi:hypothetical protein